MSVEGVHRDTQLIVRHTVCVVFQLEISGGAVGVENTDNVLTVRIICFFLGDLVHSGAHNVLCTTITTDSVAVAGEVVFKVGSNT